MPNSANTYGVPFKKLGSQCRAGVVAVCVQPISFVKVGLHQSHTDIHRFVAEIWIDSIDLKVGSVAQRAFTDLVELDAPFVGFVLHVTSEPEFASP